MLTRDEAARNLVLHHFEVEPELKAVYVFAGDQGTGPDEPIRLLEVNDATLATGTVEVFSFAPSSKFPYAVQIAEVTVDEFERLLQDPSQLPDGWALEQATRIDRERAA